MVLRRVHPHALPWFPKYAFGLALLAAAAFASWAAQAPWWASFGEHRVGRWLEAPAAFAFLALVCLGAGLWASAWIRREAALAFAVFGWLLGLGAYVAVRAWDGPHPLAEPAVFAASYAGASGLLSLLSAEAHRQARTLTLTSRRLVLEEGLWRRRTRTLAAEAVTGAAWHRPLLGRAFGWGTLTVESEVLRTRRAPKKGRLAREEALPPDEWLVRGVHPVEGVARDLERVLSLATESDDKEERELVLRVMDSLPEVYRFAGERPMRAQAPANFLL